MVLACSLTYVKPLTQQTATYLPTSNSQTATPAGGLSKASIAYFVWGTHANPFVAGGRCWRQPSEKNTSLPLCITSNTFAATRHYASSALRPSCEPGRRPTTLPITPITCITRVVAFYLICGLVVCSFAGESKAMLVCGACERELPEDSYSGEQE